MKYLIIEDEQPARDLLKSYLSEYTDFELIGEYADGFSGLKGIQEQSPDLVFLDIQMPKLSGFEILELLDDPPLIIFTTAFDQFALKAFEKNAIDYLLKPYSKERLQQALEKARQQLELHENAPDAYKPLVDYVSEQQTYIDRVVVKSGTRINVVPVDEIHYLEAQDDYVMIYTGKGKHLKQATMKYFEDHLPGNEFVRIHRSYIVHIDQIDKLEHFTKESYIVILKSGAKLKTSTNGYKNLKTVLKF